jgi:hypothetical protein
MDPLVQLPPRQVDRRVREFCRRLSPGERPLWVPVVPEPWAQYLDCYENVAQQVRAAGGSSVLGWQISAVPQIFLEAQHHAIWQSPAGAWRDVTPEEFAQPRILFLRDASRAYTGARVPPERFWLGKPALAQEYAALADELARRAEALELAGFPDGHPLHRQRLGPLLERMLALQARLQQGLPRKTGRATG